MLSAPTVRSWICSCGPASLRRISPVLTRRVSTKASRAPFTLFSVFASATARPSGALSSKQSAVRVASKITAANPAASALATASGSVSLLTTPEKTPPCRMRRSASREEVTSPSRAGSVSGKRRSSASASAQAEPSIQQTVAFTGARSPIRISRDWKSSESEKSFCTASAVTPPSSAAKRILLSSKSCILTVCPVKTTIFSGVKKTSKNAKKSVDISFTRCYYS